MSLDGGNYRSLVDTKGGRISREIYLDEEIYKREQEQIFARAWLYVGHESQIRNPGDFFLSRMGEESVIVTRDREKKINVLLNSCRHRGMKVCRYDEGNTSTFFCPYHAWGYSLDGRLLNVNSYEKAYSPPFDKKQWGLVRAAKIATLRGTIWATWDENAPSFDEYLGAARDALEVAFSPLDGGDGGIEVLGGVQKWLVRSNWKIIEENGSGDVLHATSHLSVDLVNIGPTGKTRRDAVGSFALSAHPEGHGFVYTKWPIDQERQDYLGVPIVREWFVEKWRLRKERLGARAGVWPLLGAVFPNMSFHAQQPRTILVAHPSGANQTEMWRVCFVDADAPVEVRQFMRRYFISYSGPGGMTEQDDMENWQYATDSCRGTISKRHPFHYSAGLGQGGIADEQIPGAVTEHPIESEQNPRAVYRRWAEFMDAGSWSELFPVRPE
jgi:phenylpropionate dioxygenase-like ring-hydroxylating dioxygenase large terminal subunit